MDNVNWELYKDYDELWYWQVWDDTNSKWWVSDSFQDFTEAKRARDSMMSDYYQEESKNDT